MCVNISKCAQYWHNVLKVGPVLSMFITRSGLEDNVLSLCRHCTTYPFRLSVLSVITRVTWTVTMPTTEWVNLSFTTSTMSLHTSVITTLDEVNFQI